MLIKTLNVVNSRCCFAEDGTDLFITACRTCSTIIFPHSANQILNLWRCRCRSCRWCFNTSVCAHTNVGIWATVLHPLIDYSAFTWLWIRHLSCSAVARGGARGARAPPVFFLKSKNRPVQNVENKILSSNCLRSFQKKTCRWSLRLPLRQIRQFNNYELTMMTLKRQTFTGFKIQR